MLKYLMRILLGGLILSILCWLLLTLAYCIPLDAIRGNLLESLHTLQEEDVLPAHYTALGATYYDNFTTAIMLNEAAHCDGNPLVESLLNYRADVDAKQIESLSLYLTNPTNPSLVEISYGRYWHGYLLFLKPALLFFNLKEIRVILQTTFLILLVGSAIFLARKFQASGILLAVALTLSLGFLGGPDAAATLPIFPSFAIALLGIIWMAVRKFRTLFELAMSYVLIGVLVAFFDFLDNPILTICLPLTTLAIRLLYECDTKQPALFSIIRKNAILSRFWDSRAFARPLILLMAICFATWAIGYGGFWILKWILASIVTGANVLDSGFGAINSRVGANDYGSLEAITLNVGRIGIGKYLIVVLMVVSIFIIATLFVFSVKNRFKNGPMRDALNRTLAVCIVIFLIALIPFAWYAIVRNHSAEHYYFISYRNLTVTFFCLFTIAFEGPYFLSKRSRLERTKRRLLKSFASIRKHVN